LHACVEGHWLADRTKDNLPVLAVVTGFGHVEELNIREVPEPSDFLKQALLRLRSND